MNPNPPSYDQTMNLLGSIMETYSFRDFAPILRDKDRLKAWVQERMQPESNLYLDPEDPRVGETATLSADSEQKAMEFLGEIRAEDRERIKAVFLELWGREGRATLPISMND